MIRHVVLVRFRPDVSAAERSALAADLAALQAGMPGFVAIASGPNISPEGLGHGFDDGFVIDFADAAARDAYLADEGHTVIGARIGAAAQGGADGILVFDLHVG